MSELPDPAAKGEAVTADDLLRRAGWTEGRRVPVDHAVVALRQAGYEPWPGLESMLAEFCFLTIPDTSGERSLLIDPTIAVVDADQDWITEYEGLARQRLAPVGGYSHITVMYGSDSTFYGGYDREFGPLGSSVEAVVDGLFCTSPPEPLSMPR